MNASVRLGDVDAFLAQHAKVAVSTALSGAALSSSRLVSALAGTSVDRHGLAMAKTN